MTNEEILQKLEEEIHLRGFSPHTLEEYVTRAKLLMRYADRPLEEFTELDLRAYLLYLLDVKKLSPATVNVYNSAIRFLYGAILHRHLNYYDIPRFKKGYTYPTVLTMQEVQQIFDGADSLRDKTMLHFEKMCSEAMTKCMYGGRFLNTWFKESFFENISGAFRSHFIIGAVEEKIMIKVFSFYLILHLLQ